MKPITTFVVKATLPERLLQLKELSYNYWWSWNADAKELFLRIDRQLWREVNHNPVELLNKLPQERLKELSEQEDFVAYLDYVHQRFRQYMDAKTWWNSSDSRPSGTIAYFCCEFGINESFSNYSGGLGILAGDHLKSASDLGVPLVAVGLLYQQGYFRQYMTQNGWQNERYNAVDFYSIPLQQVFNDRGEPIVISVDLPLGPCFAQVWRLNCGRVPLYLLDSNIPRNEVAEYRNITGQLYGGTTETRIQQEILLGIGGMRALKQLAIVPSAIHMNEGHAAFASLERCRNLMSDHGLDFREALELNRASTVFTTHTPVPAGNEVFSLEMIDKYLEKYVASIGLTKQAFHSLGKLNPLASVDDGFSMTVLGLKTSSYRNGVSQLHGEVARKMWHSIWKDFPLDEVPITAITNGIHTQTWIARELAELYDRYLTTRWRTETDDTELWKQIDSIPNEELWRIHVRRRERLILFARKHLHAKEGSMLSPEMADQIDNLLDPDALTIGFARRFATYKRGTLLFRDMKRLASILKNADRPVQILIAGKAHPLDSAGKEMIQKILHEVRQHGLERHVVFLEDYDMHVARFLVKGTDIWLNTPRRPYEASGTSGMKAALNGVLHTSIPDGWWAEGAQPTNGFTIGHGEEFFATADEQDVVESETLYDLLEEIIIPMFYDRAKNKVPDKWVGYMKNNIRTNAPQFSSTRMVREYANRFYGFALKRFADLSSDSAHRIREFTSWRNTIKENWKDVIVSNVIVTGASDASVGKEILISSAVELGSVSPDDVTVQAMVGKVSSKGLFESMTSVDLTLANSTGSLHVYEGTTLCTMSGVQGCNVRVLPRHQSMSNPAELFLCEWGE